jgi:peptide methionine sulfoxide reductase msrA/msrB
MEYCYQRQKGVLTTRVGYIGGHKKKPSYIEVYSGDTGHAEALEITFDTSKTDYETLARYFFEIHDPTQVNRQGPDVGEQYRSAIFYVNEKQKAIAEKLIKILEGKGYKIATKLVEATDFYEAEPYHQDYYLNTGKQPYCHAYTKRF